MRLLRRLLGSTWLRACVGVGTVAFVVIAVISQWHRIGPRLGDLSVSTIVGGTFAVVGGLFAMMLAWHALLADLGTRRPVKSIARIFFAGQLGKYLPGSVWPVVMQMELGVEYDVPRGGSVAATLVQMGMSIATGALVSVATLPFVLTHSRAELTWMPVVLVVSVIALHPRVANGVLNFVFRVTRRQALAQPLSGRGLAAAGAWQLVGWVLFAIPVILAAHDLGAAGARSVALGIGAFALSWVAGFLFVLAPAGAGVRETLMVALLTTSLSSGAALTVALVSRFMMTFGDILLGVTAVAGLGRTRLRKLRGTRPEMSADAGIDSAR